MNVAYVQHRLRTSPRPMHPRALHPILYQMTASPPITPLAIQPFDPPKTGKIAVKFINYFGDEVLKVYAV